MIVFPGVAAGFWVLNRDLIEHVDAQLSNRLKRTTPQRWIFEDRLFFDTPYHLNRIGREVRTQQLAGVLQAVVNEPPQMDQSVSFRRTQTSSSGDR